MKLRAICELFYVDKTARKQNEPGRPTKNSVPWCHSRQLFSIGRWNDGTHYLLGSTILKRRKSYTQSFIYLLGRGAWTSMGRHAMRIKNSNPSNTNTYNYIHKFPGNIMFTMKIHNPKQYDKSNTL